VKNSIINEEHPFGDELKILRKTIRKMLTDTKYNSEAFAEFKAYNEFAESI
jgi:ribosomal protein L13